MRSGVEYDLVAAAKAFIDEYFHAIKLAKRRHGSRFAAGEPVFEFRLGGNCNGLGADCLARDVDLNPPRCRYDRHDQLLIRFQNYSLGHLIARDMRQRCSALGGKCPDVRDHLVTHVLSSKELYQFPYW